MPPLTTLVAPAGTRPTITSASPNWATGSSRPSTTGAACGNTLPSGTSRPARHASGSPERPSTRSVEEECPGPRGNFRFVFHREDGRPLHPEYVLNHFHYLARQAGVPRTSVHDLRHLAATLALTHGVELTIVSKTLRHSTISTTANIYGHLTKPAARQAVDAIAKQLDREEKRYDHPTTTNRKGRPRLPAETASDLQ
ncbi:tyrosine-type recombinase/integrase [Streptomyces sp. NPDC007983]|uniref:tyrosine-type recombinase/integrase n=1 Tax=Streptomyces sp. NPDC007983 TaxID=3364800 RepID=UPI0036E5DD4F